MSNDISRPALGQVASIGSLYDARNDTFQTISLFDFESSPGFVSRHRLDKIDIRVSHGESYLEKLKGFDVGPDLAASVLSGLVQPDGLVRHLVEQNDSSRRLQASIYYTIILGQKKLDLRKPDLRKHIPSQTLRTSEATHIVVEIDYGAQTVVMLNQWLQQYEVKDQKELRFKQKTEALIKSIQNPVADRPSNATDEFDQITVYSTTLGNEDIVLVDSEEVLKFLDLVPLQIRVDDAGKGKPVMYRMLPIQMLAFLNLVQVEVDTTPMTPSHECMKKFVQLCDEFQVMRQPLEEYKSYAARYTFCLPPSHVKDVTHRAQEMEIAEREMKRDFARTLRSVRSGTVDPERLWQLINELNQGPRSPRALSTFTEDYQGKVSFIDSMTAKGAIYIGYNGVDLQSQISQRGNVDAYVLYFSEQVRKNQPQWDANQALMFSLLAEPRNNAFFAIVDGDATGMSMEKAFITKYHNGTIVVDDLEEEEQYLANHCFARHQSDGLETDNVQKPTKRRFVKIPCPGRGCDGATICDWRCFQCRAPLEYGYSDQYIYCDCGRSLYSNLDFKCNTSSHGPGFEKYDNARLLAFLKSLDQSDYLNVLILGETGVGKSTFINAFVNYLYFQTLDEALDTEDLHWVIPCSFATQTMDRSNINSDIVETRITVGTRDDERDGSKGASATQRTQVYPITIGASTYRLIDTPGIGDTRGLEYDKTNMADILATVSGYDHLHGILILLKSNNARLTAHFSFCIKELLVHLHRDATENVVFGFTNTRISNYMPGDTFGSLKALLEERSDIGLSLSTKVTYCFDSESFRYLAAHKNGVVMDNKQDFDGSWTKSRKEAERMLEYFRTKSPHPIKNTISLNGTRNLILELTKPMAEISQSIRTNIELCEEDVRSLQDARLTGDKLRSRLHPEKQLMKPVPLDHPRTVCSDKACLEFKDDGLGTQNMLVDYPKPCHRRCYLENVQVDVLAHPGLIGCAAFGGNETCQKCGHHWTVHIHILYELQTYKTKVKDTGVEQQIKAHANDITLKQAAIKNRHQLMSEYQKEHEQIQEAAAKFGLWMKANSIIPYNDATLAYLDIMIQSEQAKVDAGGIANRKRLADLQADVQRHKELVAVLTESMKSAGKFKMIDQDEIQRLVQHLYNLPHFGKNLEHLKIQITESHERTNRELPHRVKARRHHHQHSFASPTTAYQQMQAHNNSSPVHIATGSYHQSTSRMQPMTIHSRPLSTYNKGVSRMFPPPNSSEAMPGAFNINESSDQFRPKTYNIISPIEPFQSSKKKSSMFSALNPFR